MFRSVNASIRLLAVYAADRGLLALRWGLDATVGYQRAVEHREGVLDLLQAGGSARERHLAEQYAEYALNALRELGKSRSATGGIGAGARLAVSPAEFVDLQVAAENLRSEALRREQQNTEAQA